MDEWTRLTRRQSLATIASTLFVAGCLRTQSEPYRLHVINHSDSDLESIRVAAIQDEETAFKREILLSADQAEVIEEAFPRRKTQLRVNGNSVELPVRKHLDPSDCQSPEAYVTIDGPTEITVREKTC